MEGRVAEALMIPGYWRAVAYAEGAFTNYAVQAIPHQHLPKFKKYLSQLVKDGLLTGYRTLLTSDVLMNFPDFEHFDSRRRVWTFNWKAWLRKASRGSARKSFEEPKDYAVQADRTDLIILTELELDGRRKFARIAKVVGVTLQAIKFRYDRRIVPRGLVRDYGYNFLTFPVEVSDIREVKLDFRSLNALNSFFSAARGLPFIASIARILGENSLILRTYLPNAEFTNMLSFISSLADSGVISDYSMVRLHFRGMRAKTLSPEMFSNETGWQYDLETQTKQARRLLASAPKPLAS
jgi:DNA-binding Lrp family transcriptional regulator